MTRAIDEPEKLDAMLALYGLKRETTGVHRYRLTTLNGSRRAWSGGEWFFTGPLEMYLEAFRMRHRRHGQITMGRELIEYLGGTRD